MTYCFIFRLIYKPKTLLRSIAHTTHFSRLKINILFKVALEGCEHDSELSANDLFHDTTKSSNVRWLR
jgi:hypothetical protein